MSLQILRDQRSTERVAPLNPQSVVIAAVARRARVSATHAAVIAQLAGLGPEHGSDRFARLLLWPEPSGPEAAGASRDVR